MRVVGGGARAVSGLGRDERVAPRDADMAPKALTHPCPATTPSMCASMCAKG